MGVSNRQCHPTKYNRLVLHKVSCILLDDRRMPVHRKISDFEMHLRRV